MQFDNRLRTDRTEPSTRQANRRLGMAGRIGRQVRTVLRGYSRRTETRRHVHVVSHIVQSGQSEISAGKPTAERHVGSGKNRNE